MSDTNSAPQDPIWSQGEIDMTWRDDELFVGGVYVGIVWHDPWGDILETGRPWVSILMDCSVSSKHRHHSEQAARDALVDAAVRALLGRNV